MSKKILILILLLPALFSAQTDQKKDVWQSLKVLEGIWEGQGDGMSGISQVTQEYKFILKGKFLQMKTSSIFEPQEKNPRGEHHEDMAVFSYDQNRKKFILRSFYIEGFVIQYLLDDMGEEEKTLTFVSENVENGPPGTKARLVFKFTKDDEMEQSFFVAFSGSEFSCFVVNNLKRKK